MPRHKAMACLLRIVIPIAAPLAVYLCAGGDERRPALYPSPEVCSVVALLVLLSIGGGWCAGDASGAKDAAYLILTALLLLTIVIGRKSRRESRATEVALFLVSFLIYSCADARERLLIAPAVAAFAIDGMIKIAESAGERVSVTSGA